MRPLAISLVAGAGLLSFAVMARPVTFELPADGVPAELAGSDARLVADNCAGCHSLDYITTQPRGKGEQFWRDSVTKMITVYKAPVSAEDAEAIARMLGHKFG